MKPRAVFVRVGLLCTIFGLACASGTGFPRLDMMGPALTPLGVGLVGAGALPDSRRVHGLLVMAMFLLAAGTLGPLLLEKLATGDDRSLLVLVLLFWFVPAGGGLLFVAFALAVRDWLLSRRGAVVQRRG